MSNHWPNYNFTMIMIEYTRWSVEDWLIFYIINYKRGMILSKEGGDTQPLILRNSYVYVYGHNALNSKGKWSLNDSML